MFAFVVNGVGLVNCVGVLAKTDRIQSVYIVKGLNRNKFIKIK